MKVRCSDIFSLVRSDVYSYTYTHPFPIGIVYAISSDFIPRTTQTPFFFMTALESETYLQSMLLSLGNYIPQEPSPDFPDMLYNQPAEKRYDTHAGLFLPTCLLKWSALVSSDKSLTDNLLGVNTRGRVLIYDMDTIKLKFNFYSSRLRQTEFAHTEDRLRLLNTDASDMSLIWHVRAHAESGAASSLSPNVTPIKLRQKPDVDTEYDPKFDGNIFDTTTNEHIYMSLYMNDDLVDPALQKNALSLRQILDRAQTHGKQLESAYNTHVRPPIQEDCSIPPPPPWSKSNMPSSPTPCSYSGDSALPTDVEYELADVDDTSNGMLTQFVRGLISTVTLVPVLTIGLAVDRDACVDFWVRRAGRTGIHVMSIDALDSSGYTAPITRGGICGIHHDLDIKRGALLDVNITERFRTTVSSHPLAVDGDLLCPLNQQTFINNVLASTNSRGVSIVSALCLTSQNRSTSDARKQERSHFRTLLGELIIAVGVLAHGGMLLCKLVNTWQSCTVSILRFLFIYFDEVRFIRPLRCSPLGNEQYVLCTGYRVTSALTRSHAAGLLLHFQQMSLKDDGKELIAMTELPDNWIAAIVDWNNTKIYSQVAHMEAVCTAWQLETDNTTRGQQGDVMTNPVNLDRLSFVEFQSDEYAHLVNWRNQCSLSRPLAWWWDEEAVNMHVVQHDKTTVYLNASIDTALLIELGHCSSVVRAALTARSLVVKEKRNVLDKTVARFHVQQFHEKFAASEPRSYIIHRSQEEWLTQDISGRVSPVSVIIAGKDILWVSNAPCQGLYTPSASPTPSSAFSSSVSLVSVTNNRPPTEEVKWDFPNPLLPGTVAIGTVDVTLKRLTIFQILLLPGSPPESVFVPISTQESEHLASVYCSAIRSVVVTYAPPMSTRDVDDAHMALDNEHILVQCPGIVDTAMPPTLKEGSFASSDTSDRKETPGWSIVNVTRRHHAC
jgi:hypothetical protein